MLSDRLQSSLTLTIAGTSYEIPGGQIKHLELELATHGFRGALEFVLTCDDAHGGSTSDELATSFLELDLIEVSLTTQWILIDDSSASSADETELEGLVEAKSLVEEVYRDTKDLPVLARRYRVEFADPAQVLWRQHFPCELYTDKSVADVLGEHTGSYITLDCQWERLSEQKPLFFVHLPADRGVSFYEFVMWYLDSQGGYWYYDYGAGKYVIAGEKDSSGVAIEPLGDRIERVVTRVAAAPRSQPRVLNSYTEDARVEAIEQSQAVTGVYRDLLVRTSIAQDLDDRVTLETARSILPLYELEMSLTRGPVDSVVPGTLVTFDATRRWSSESALVSKSWRIVRGQIRVDAAREGVDDDAQRDSAAVTGELTLALEQEDDPRAHLPPFRAPCYPGLIEGKVVSEQGEDTDKTYQVYTDEDTSLETYQVKVPLWSDQVVTSPFEPHLGSGNVYVPAYRDARVLLAIDLEQAHITRLLDWREGAPLSMDVQGEQLYFGKTATSRTTVSHQYDQDKPVFEIARLNDKDTATVRIEEGTLTIEVKEDTE